MKLNSSNYLLWTNFFVSYSVHRRSWSILQRILQHRVLLSMMIVGQWLSRDDLAMQQYDWEDQCKCHVWNYQRDIGYFEGDVFQQEEYFSYYWYAKEVILAATGWSLSLTTTLSWKRLDELDFYQPLVLDLNVLQQYRDELVVVKFISELDKTKFEYKFLMVMSFFSQLLCPEFIVFLWEVILLLVFLLVLRTLLW